MSDLQRTVLVPGAQGVTGLAAAQFYSSFPQRKGLRSIQKGHGGSARRLAGSS